MRHEVHPLIILAGNTRRTYAEILNELQDKGLVSDNCVEIHEVAIEDAVRVIDRIGKGWMCVSRAHRAAVQQTARPE